LAGSSRNGPKRMAAMAAVRLSSSIPSPRKARPDHHRNDTVP
jgi:hypothetical protein